MGCASFLMAKEEKLAIFTHSLFYKLKRLDRPGLFIEIGFSTQIMTSYLTCCDKIDQYNDFKRQNQSKLVNFT